MADYTSNYTGLQIDNAIAGIRPIDTSFNTAVLSNITLQPNKHYILGPYTGITGGSIALDTVTDNAIQSEFSFEFSVALSASSPTITISSPTLIQWENENNPTSFTAGKHYEFNVRYNHVTENYYGIWAEFNTYLGNE